MLRALMAALSRMAMFSIFSFLNLFCQACLLAIKRVVEVMTVSITRRLFATSEFPVSVSSTIASTRRALTSVAPQLNSTLTSIFSVGEKFSGYVDQLGGDDAAFEVLWLFDLSILRGRPVPILWVCLSPCCSQARRPRLRRRRFPLSSRSRLCPRRARRRRRTCSSPARGALSVVSGRRRFSAESFCRIR